MTNRYDYFDCAKGVSIFLVVVFHATAALESHGLAGKYYWMFNDFMSAIRMPMFFFISGFLARKAIATHLKAKFGIKLAGLLYLFALWSLIHLIWQTMLPYASDPELASWVRFLYSPSSVLWFLWALAIFFCVARAGQALNKEIIFALSCVLSMTSYLGLVEFNNYAHNNVLMFMPIFLFGAWYSDRLLTSSVLGHWLTAPALLAVLSVIFIAGYRGNIPRGLESIAVLLTPMLGVVVGLSVSMCLCRVDFLKRVPIYLGQNTLGIYVAHAPVVGLLASGFGVTVFDSEIISSVGVPLVSVAAVFMSLAMKLFLDRIGGWWLYQFPLAVGNDAHGSLISRIGGHAARADPGCRSLSPPHR